MSREQLYNKDLERISRSCPLFVVLFFGIVYGGIAR